MKAVYFSQKDTKRLTKNLGIATSHVFATLTPMITNFLSYKFLFNPYSDRKYTISTTLDYQEFYLDLKEEKLKLYFFKGGDKHILLSHGWGGSTRHFKTLIPKLIEQGYSVWSFDHLGHGHSSGNKSHLFGFIEGLDKVIDFIEIDRGIKLEGVVGHSMGGVALMNLNKQRLHSLKQIYIAVPVNFFEIMFDKISKSGIAKKVISNSLKDISKKYNSDWHRLRPLNNKDKLNDLSLFIHDEDDSYAPHQDIIEFNKVHTTKVLSTSGLGHGRILKDDNVFNYINDHLRA